MSQDQLTIEERGGVPPSQIALSDWLTAAYGDQGHIKTPINCQ